MTPMFLILCLVFPAWLSAESSESRRAREILSEKSYKGYRIVPAPSGHGSQPDDSSDQPGRGATPGPTSRQEADRYRRSSRSSRPSPPRRSTSRSEERPTPPEISTRPVSYGTTSLDPRVMAVVFWVIIGVAGLIAAAFIIRAIIDRRPRKKSKAQAAGTSEASPQAEAPATPAGRFPELQAQLDAAIAAGDFALASLLAYRLFWLNAGWQGVIDQREVATWRDALRMVNNEDIRREIRRLLFLVECVRYGRHRPQREEFLEWRARLDSIDTQTVLG